MILDAALLFWCCAEHLERLATHLRLRLPPRRLHADPRRYRWRLARELGTALLADGLRAGRTPW